MHMCAIDAIVGAGPAGCAAALTLRRYLPKMDVLLISKQTANSSHGSGVGESLSPGVLPLLDYLGIKEEFFRLGNLPSWSTASSWGTEQLFEREYLFIGRGSGWQIDRCKFDAWLLGIVEGADIRCVQARAVQTAYNCEGWCIDLDDGETIEADAIVDATGRAAWLSRSQGLSPRRDDALVAEARWYVHDESASNLSGALVETTEYGWWYTSMLPDRRGVAMFMTDADLRNKATWEEKLARAPATRARMTSWHATGESAVRVANSQKSAMVAGKGWVSAGDAAVAFDPVSSLGIGFSLRSGMEAARVAVAASEKDDAAAAVYDASVSSIYADYLRRLRKIYWREHRWPAAPFWARRRRNDQRKETDALGN